MFRFFISYEQVFRFFYFHNSKGKFSLRPGVPSAEVKLGAGPIADGRDHSFVAYRAARRYADQFRFS